MRNEIRAATFDGQPRRDPSADDYVQIAGHRIHYRDEGSGPSILFVHAGPAWSFIYRDAIALLRAEFRCIALDFPGSGLSQAAPGYPARIESAAAVFEAFVQQLDLKDLTLVVHDLGGPVALKCSPPCRSASSPWPSPTPLPGRSLTRVPESSSRFGS